VVNATIQVNYRIDNPHDVLFRIESGPNQLVTCAVSAALSQTLSRFAVDEALTSKKIAIENQVKTIAQAILDRHHTGIHLLVTHIPEIYPPQEVASAFREVLDAKAAQLQQINEAGISADLKISDARTEAFELQKQAEAAAEERLQTAQARSQSLLKLLTSHHQDALKHKLLLETLNTMLKQSRKVLVAPDQKSHVTIIK
jgi:membrane protease subunit HflK